MPSGSAAKAALVGANTVKGPSPFSVSTSPAAFTAATSVVWSAELIGVVHDVPGAEHRLPADHGGLFLCLAADHGRRLVHGHLGLAAALCPAVEAPARVTRRRARKYRVVLGMASVSHETGEVE